MKILIIFTLYLSIVLANLDGPKPDDIIDIKTVAPSILHDIRYFSKNNFVGEEITGYLAPKCFLQKNAAIALKKVQSELSKQNLEILIYDCYRPQAAVNHFINWASRLEETIMKPYFYPNVHKKDLFAKGYIAAKSGHSKGNTIDLGLVVKNSKINSIISLPPRDCRLENTAEERNAGLINMGTAYDCFDPLSHTMNQNISNEAKENRKLLVKTLKNHGFRNYSKEWWHFTHNENAYPNTYHNFFVE